MESAHFFLFFLLFTVTDAIFTYNATPWLCELYKHILSFHLRDNNNIKTLVLIFIFLFLTKINSFLCKELSQFFNKLLFAISQGMSMVN